MGEDTLDVNDGLEDFIAKDANLLNPAAEDEVKEQCEQLFIWQVLPCWYSKCPNRMAWARIRWT